MSNAQSYIAKCLELSERATTVYFNTVEHVSERGFRAVGSCHKNIESAEQDLDSMTFRLTALPKVCEALKLAMEALDNRMHEDWCQVSRGFGDCDCNLANNAFARDRISKLFDEADVNNGNNADF